MNPQIRPLLLFLLVLVQTSCGSVVRNLDKEEVLFEDRLEHRDLKSQYHVQSMIQNGAVVSGRVVEELVQAEVKVVTNAMRVPTLYTDGRPGGHYTPAQVEATKVLSFLFYLGLVGPSFTPVEWEVVEKVEAREDTGRLRTITRPASGCAVSWTLFTGQGQVSGEIEADEDGNWLVGLASYAGAVSDNLDLYEEGKIVLQPGPGSSSATLRVDFVELVRSVGVPGLPGDSAGSSPDALAGDLRASFLEWE